MNLSEYLTAIADAIVELQTGVRKAQMTFSARMEAAQVAYTGDPMWPHRENGAEMVIEERPEVEPYDPIAMGEIPPPGMVPANDGYVERAPTPEGPGKGIPILPELARGNGPVKGAESFLP